MAIRNLSSMRRKTIGRKAQAKRIANQQLSAKLASGYRPAGSVRL